MQSITPEQYEKYINVLNWDLCKMDLRYLIFKYGMVLYNYYDEDVYDADKLNLIVDDFLYFFGLELFYDQERVASMALNLKKSYKTASEISDFERAVLYSFLISSKIKKKVDIIPKHQILYKMLSILISIQNYIEQYGDLNTYVNELRMYVNKIQEEIDDINEKIKQLKKRNS